MWILFTALVTGNYIKDAKRTIWKWIQRLTDSIKDSTDVTLAADDDKEILEDSVENVDAGDVKAEPDELQTPGQIWFQIAHHHIPRLDPQRLH